MKPLNISQNIISLSDFKNKAARTIHEIQSSHRPFVITQNGKAAAVLISPKAIALTELGAHIVHWHACHDGS
ncbi:MAG: type II toxin-antitoxin system Phd/YefM family antitoxin [Desulfobacterales bacterium]